MPFIFNKLDWVHNVALEHCLLDPRWSNGLLAAITRAAIEEYSTDPNKKLYVSTAPSEEVLVVNGKKELFTDDANYYALGATLEEKESVKIDIKKWRKNLEEKIKSAIATSIINDKELELENLGLPQTLIHPAQVYQSKITSPFPHCQIVQPAG